MRGLSSLCLPASLRCETNSPICDCNPKEGLINRYRKAQNINWECKRPGWIEVKVSLLVVDRKTRDDQCHFNQPTEHNVDKSKKERSQIYTTTCDWIWMEWCPQKHWHGDCWYQTYLQQDIPITGHHPFFLLDHECLAAACQWVTSRQSINSNKSKIYIWLVSPNLNYSEDIDNFCALHEELLSCETGLENLPIAQRIFLHNKSSRMTFPLLKGNS